MTKQIPVDVRCIAVDGCHVPAQPVIYAVVWSGVHARDFDFVAYTSEQDAVKDKQANPGMDLQVIKLLLETPSKEI